MIRLMLDRKKMKVKALAVGMSAALLLPCTPVTVFSEENYAIQENGVNMQGEAPAQTPEANVPSSTVSPVQETPAAAAGTTTVQETPAAAAGTTTAQETPAAATEEGGTKEETPAASAEGGTTEGESAAATEEGGTKEETPAASAEGGTTEGESAAATEEGGTKEETPAASAEEGTTEGETAAETEEGGTKEETPAAAAEEGTTEGETAAATEEGGTKEETPAASAEEGTTEGESASETAEGSSEQVAPAAAEAPVAVAPAAAETPATAETSAAPAEAPAAAETPVAAAPAPVQEITAAAPETGMVVQKKPAASRLDENAPAIVEDADVDEELPSFAGDPNKGAYYYGSKEDKADITDTYIYDDDLLKGDSRTYSAELATMSLSLVNASIGSIRADYPNKSQNLRAFLEDNGFSDFEANQDYQKAPALDTMGVACAHKKITDDGKTYTLLVIAPRSAGYKTEWGGNFDVGTDGDHEGFSNARDIVFTFVRDYIQRYGITGDIKIWTAGGSRGAGVINLVGAELLKNPSGVLGSTVSLDPRNLYCYTFGTPKTADSTQADFAANNETLYAYIHNLSESNDVVGTFVPSEMGFGRYGITTGYTDPNKKEDMLEYLNATSEAMYRVFTHGGDPDTFTPMTVDFEKLLKERKISITPEKKDSYLTGKDQDYYMSLLESTMADVFKNRENYVENYQEPMMRFFGYVYGGSGELGTLFGGVKDSGYMLPTALTMYISVVMESYLNGKSVTADTVADLQEAIGNMDSAIQQMQDEGYAPSQEMLDQYTALKSGLMNAELSLDLLNISWKLAASFYGKAMAAGLNDVKSDALSDDIKAQLASPGDSMAMTKLLSHMLLVDRDQKQSFGLQQLGEQFVHLATTLGNAKSFMTPHYNEVILSWLRTDDPNYQDFERANSAQTTGYRRVFVDQPEGVDVTGTVKDSKGNVVAVFRNGELISRANNWIGITISDEGNWLRLPLDDTYKIDFDISEDTTINVRVSEYSVDTGNEVRVETSDSKYNWQNFAIRPVDSATLVLSAINGNDGVYSLNNGAAYYFDLLRRFFINYDLNGGTLDGNSGTVTEVYDDGTGITLPTPTRDGYRFAYWEGSQYNAGDLYTVIGDHSFRAIWEKIISDPEPDPEPDPDPEPVPGSDPEPSPEPVPGCQPEPVPGCQPDDGCQPIPGSQPASGYQTVSLTQTSVQSQTTPQVRTETLDNSQVTPAKTADTNPIAMWLAIMAASLYATAMILKKRLSLL